MPNRRTFSRTIPVTLSNISDKTLQAPIRMVVEYITNSNVSLSNPDGTTEDGKSFFELQQTDLVNGEFQPGETAPVIKPIFIQGARNRFTFKTSLWADVKADDGGGGDTDPQ